MLTLNTSFPRESQCILSCSFRVLKSICFNCRQRRRQKQIQQLSMAWRLPKIAKRMLQLFEKNWPKCVKSIEKSFSLQRRHS